MTIKERPGLDENIDANLFIEYYYSKEELQVFCKRLGLQSSGSKNEIKNRIEHFLRTDQKIITEKSIKSHNKIVFSSELTLDKKIEANFRCSEEHRAFFKSIIGEKFHFNVVFQKYLKENCGKTYADAVDAYYKIDQEKKENKGLNKIDSQFEYNRYIRAFFNDNKGKTLKDAINCWKYKRSLPGTNEYERNDLVALESKIRYLLRNSN